MKVNQYGVRVGGPIKIPGAFDLSGKAFYFFHYEELRFPNSFTRTRTVHPARSCRAGSRIRPAAPTRVNVMTLAANTGNIPTPSTLRSSNSSVSSALEQDHGRLQRLRRTRSTSSTSGRAPARSSSGSPLAASTTTSRRSTASAGRCPPSGRPVTPTT